METKEDIWKELREIAPGLAAMDKVNPYELPDGYFNSFSLNVLNTIKLGAVKAELSALAPAMAALNKPFASVVPANYFNSFSGKLIDKIRQAEVTEEVAQIAPALSKLEKLNAAQVPADYFNHLPAQILNNIQQQKPAVQAATPGLTDALDNLFDRWINAIFRPKYTVAFAGFATTLILAVMMVMKVQQCDDLDCRFAQLSNEEINNYLENKSDAYSEEVFEMNVNENMSPSDIKETSLHVYKDALKDVDDASLNEAIEN